MNATKIALSMCFAVVSLSTIAEVAVAAKPDIKTEQVLLIHPTKNSRILLRGENFDGVTKDSITIRIKGTNVTFDIKKTKLVAGVGVIIVLKAPEGLGDPDDVDELTVTVINDAGEMDTKDVDVVIDDEV